MLKIKIVQKYNIFMVALFANAESWNQAFIEQWVWLDKLLCISYNEILESHKNE